MSAAEPGRIEGILDELRTWPSSDRARLARAGSEKTKSESGRKTMITTATRTSWSIPTLPAMRPAG
jgi:hypothetical protein